MSEEMREQINKVKNFKEFVNESVNKPSIDINSLNGYWESYNSGIMAGKKDDGYVSIKNEDDLHTYITNKLGDVVNEIKMIEKGKTYPYNRSNPYYHDSYFVTLVDGTTFEITRIYGRPNWSGNVDYKEQLEVSNIKQNNFKKFFTQNLIWNINVVLCITIIYTQVVFN